MKKVTFVFQLAALAAALMLVGCDSGPQNPPAKPALSTPAPTGITPLSENDPSVQDEDRLGNICGALLIYFQANGQLPARFEDLHNVDSDLSFAAPSGQDFVYVPGGLALPDGSLTLLVYDPVELPNGKRWVIITKSLHAVGTLSYIPAPMPEADFQKFMAAAQH